MLEVCQELVKANHNKLDSINLLADKYGVTILMINIWQIL